MKETFKNFFTRHPAVLYSLSFLFGVQIALGIYSVLFLSFFFFPFWKKVLPFVLLAWIYTKIFYPVPSLEVVKGEAEVKIISKREGKRGGWVYRATLLSFIPDEEEKSVARGLSCSLFSREEKESNCHYLIQGTLSKKRGHFYSLKGKWTPLEKRISLVDLRYEGKNFVKNYLRKMIPHEKASTFLSGLATAELDDSVLQKTFEKKGLSHLLAISGFHFSMIALSFQFLLRPFFPFKWTTSILLLILSLYFLFIGNTPSVERAWIMSLVTLLGLLLEKRGSGLNALGVALLIALLLNPLVIFNAGFTLSYLATGGILLLFSPLEKSLKSLISIKFLRESLTLGVAVHLVILLPLFSLFHRFPLQGLLYNLFFPHLVIISLFLLIFGSLIHLIFPIGAKWIHLGNSYYTEGILNSLEWRMIPHQTIYMSAPPEWVITLYLGVVLFSGILLRAYYEKKESQIGLEFSYFNPDQQNLLL